MSNDEMNKKDVMAMMAYPMDKDFSISAQSANNGLNVSFSTGSAPSMTVSSSGFADMTAGSSTSAAYIYPTPAFGGWDFWQNYYYPQVIRESYPIYIRERAEDKGKQAFEILKLLQDKKLLNIEKVSDFIEAMDALIKVL